jgi:iron complex outermembrane receptor protein
MIQERNIRALLGGVAAQLRAPRPLKVLACSSASLVLMGAFGGLAHAADAQTTAATSTAGVSLGEVTVTARKRAENLQRVPVAITAQTGAQLEQQRINQPIDLQRIVPSLHVFLASGSDNSAEIAMRGQQASDILLGVSQPVGVYEDTVNIPHPFGANNAFFDLDRVEVLRGPQGTLYGRNTTAGAIDIITKGADYRGYHGFIEGEGGNFAEWKIGGAVNLPIVQDKLAVRLAYQHWNQDGFGHSLVTGEKFGNDHDDNTFRGSIKFDPISNFDAVFKIEIADAHHTAPMLSDYYFSSDTSINSLGNLTLENQALWKNFTLYGGLLGAALNPATPPATAFADFNQVLAAGQATLAGCIGTPYTNCSSVKQFDNLQTAHGVLDLKWQLTPDILLRSLTGYHWFKNVKAYDLGGFQSDLLDIGYGVGGYQPFLGPSIPFKLNPDQEDGQWSQEFDLSGKALDNHLDWLVGGFASWDKGHEEETGVALDPILAYFAAFSPPGGEAPFGNESVDTTNTWAVYSQEDFHISQQLSLTLGIRYTSETIGSSAGNWSYNPTTGVLTCNGADYPSLALHTYLAPNQSDPTSCQGNVLSTGPNDVFSTAKFNGLSYLGSLNYQFTPDVMAYFKTSRGFRGGAFGRALQPAAKPETDVDYELGLKGDFFDHRFRANLAVYTTGYNNKQVSALVCTVPSPQGGCSVFTTILENAATARIQGLEWDLQAIPFDNFTLFTTGSVTHSVYTKFNGAVGANGAPIAGPGNPEGSVAGEPLGVTPNLQLDVGGRYEIPVGPGRLGAQLDYAYQSGIPLTLLTVDPSIPISVQEDQRKPIGLVNGRIDWKDADMGLTLSFWCTNIANTVSHNETLLFPSGFVGGAGQETMNPPRTFGFTVRKTFGE